MVRRNARRASRPGLELLEQRTLLTTFGVDVKGPGP